MEDLDVLARDFGYRPQGKSAPMRSDASAGRHSSTARSSASSSPLFDDAFPKFTNTSNNSFNNDFDYGSIFKNNSNNNNINSNDNSKTSSLPVYDKPVYDDDIFEGLSGTKSKSVSTSSTTTMRFQDNVFASTPSSSEQNRKVNDQFYDFLSNLARNEKVPEPKSSGRSSSSRGLDDLVGSFSSSNPAIGGRTTPESQKPQKKTSVKDDPFVVLGSTSTPASSSSGMFTDPLEEITNLGVSGSSKANAASVSGGDFDDLDPLNGLGKSVPPFSTENGSLRMGQGISGTQTSSSRDHMRSSFRYSESPSQKKAPVDNFQESPLFDMPGVSTDSKNSFSQTASSPQYTKNFQEDISLNQQAKSDDIWLSVSEVPLFTEPTKAPPPSRPPPPIPQRAKKAESGFFSASVRKKGDEYSPRSYSGSPKPGYPVGGKPSASQIDELEKFVTGNTQNSVDANANVNSSEEMGAAAAAMKDAMDRAEAKFRHAKEVRDREYAKAARSKESVQTEKGEHIDIQEREFRKNEVRLERERQHREKEEEEREQRRLERERERARQAEIERLRARQAVERATREARGRAAAEARLKSERASVGKAQAEARERAERAAVQRAQAEARERAAAEARERAAAEARAKESQQKDESRCRAERAAVEKAAAEARERAAAAASRMNKQKDENDLESFFGARPSSAPKARANSSDPVFDSQFRTKAGPDSAKRTSSTSVPSSNMRKASSTTNIVDDLSSIFGAPPSSGEFQEVEGESEERRKSRLERHQRTQERAAKALAEKNQRDLQVQREQEERNRIGETLDFEIKRWAAGKEGNLRALLSTLQYVLWPECGWQPVSLTDLIAGASVKKVYRKATLCIHPDKVQQKGASLQQKYIAEKVFDLLKEAWNKFNSEELF